MNPMMKQLEILPMRWQAGACSLVLMFGMTHAGRAQQTAKAPAPSQGHAQTVSSASDAFSVNAFAPTSFSSLLPGAATPQSAAKPVAEEEEESPKPNSAGHQGVKVHGHWVMQVKNVDGTLGERREFENSLVTTTTLSGGNSVASAGSQLMVAMLSGNVTVGDPGIGFVQGDITGDASTFCTTTLHSTSSCYIFTSTNSILYGFFGSESTGLTYVANFAPVPAIVLSGNYTVPAGLTSIAAVQSLYGFCIPSSAAGFGGTTSYVNHTSALVNSATFRNADIGSLSCVASSPLFSDATEGGIAGALTSTPVMAGAPAVPTPLTVTPGQVIQISVTISFS